MDDRTHNEDGDVDFDLLDLAHLDGVQVQGKVLDVQQRVFLVGLLLGVEFFPQQNPIRLQLEYLDAGRELGEGLIGTEQGIFAVLFAHY